MARPGPKSKKGKPAPKSKKVEEKEPEVIESEEDVPAEDKAEENNGSTEDVKSESEADDEEPPAKKGKGKAAAKKATKKGGRASSRGRKPATKKKEESEDDEDEDETEYEVHSIIEERTRKGVHEYKVRWVGYKATSATWEPAGNLNCDEKIEEYKRKKEEAKDNTKNLREGPKKTERYVDVAGQGERHRMRHSKRGSAGKSPRKNYQEESD